MTKQDEILAPALCTCGHDRTAHFYDGCKGCDCKVCDTAKLASDDELATEWNALTPEQQEAVNLAEYKRTHAAADADDLPCVHTRSMPEPGALHAEPIEAHTPGPWRATYGPGGWRVRGTTPVAKDLREGDARLIAAAPALLSALSDMLSYATSDQLVVSPGSIERARAAIVMLDRMPEPGALAVMCLDCRQISIGDIFRTFGCGCEIFQARDNIDRKSCPKHASVDALLEALRGLAKEAQWRHEHTVRGLSLAEQAAWSKARAALAQVKP